jgi:hypothetical protein
MENAPRPFKGKTRRQNLNGTAEKTDRLEKADPGRKKG